MVLLAGSQPLSCWIQPVLQSAQQRHQVSADTHAHTHCCRVSAERFHVFALQRPVHHLSGVPDGESLGGEQSERLPVPPTGLQRSRQVRSVDLSAKHRCSDSEHT